jgi:Mn-dependent DtxR family transcriptional regulator
LQTVTYAAEKEPLNPETKQPTMDEALLITRIRKTFEESHNQCSADYLASRIGVTSEETEKTLNNLKREGRVTFDGNHETWRWVK